MLKSLMTVVAFMVFIVGCGGGGGGSGSGGAGGTPTSPGGVVHPPLPASFSIGGVVRGLNADGHLTILSGAGETFTITSNGEFTFLSKINTSTAYAITVAENPLGQVCSVNGASGSIMGANVRGIEILCNAASTTVVQRGMEVTTLSGIAGDPGANDGVREEGTFACPFGITLDGAGGLYVSDSRAKTVRKVSPAGVVSTVAGIPLSGNLPIDGSREVATFASPGGIARDLSGNLYLAEAIFDSIRKIAPDGKVSTFANIGILGSAMPVGLAIDAYGNIFAAAMTKNVILKINPAGIVTTFVGRDYMEGSADGTGSNANFNSPFGVAIDVNGNLFVSDNRNHTIRKITPAGGVTTVAGAPGIAGASDGVGAAARFRNPAGITVDRNGNLYVVDNGNRTIRKVTPAGVVSTVAGTALVKEAADGYGASASFKDPYGIVVDAAGNLFVSDCGSNTIRKLVPNDNTRTVTITPPQTVFPETAIVTTLAGSPGKTGAVDGQGTDARFGNPTSIAVDSAGNIFVGDGWPNGLLRVVSKSGNVTTLAGTKGLSNVARDGIGLKASFSSFSGMAFDGAGNIYIPGTGLGGGITNGLRKVSPSGVVTTVDVPLYGGRRIGRIAADSLGNIYGVDDVRIDKISLPTMAVQVLAGHVGVDSSLYFFDARGEAARFQSPNDIVVDTAGNVFVADSRNLVIRKITPAGVVSTFAGKAGQAGTSPGYNSAHVDGVGGLARFYFPIGLAIDGANNLYVTDNNTIRKITPNRMVTTIAGLAGVSDFVDGVGVAARFSQIVGISVDTAGTIYVIDDKTIRKIEQK